MPIPPTASRRQLLARAGGGFGAIALAYLLSRDASANPPIENRQSKIENARLPHFAPKAKSVIWLFMEGGPSHIDTFDPKPTLDKLGGKPMPASFGKVITSMGTAGNGLMPSKRKWKQHGKSGLWISDWLPYTAQCADDLAVIRSCYADGLNHVGSVCQMNTGSILAGRPAIGAWANYGLGSANENLPSFVVMTDMAEVNGGPKNWSAGFLPAHYEGTQLRNSSPPIFHLHPPKTIDDAQQRSKLDFLADLNRRFSSDKPLDSDLDARLASYELAYRMQAAAPQAVDLSTETEQTKSMYGMNDKATEKFGTNCLLARRLVECGVRFIQCYSGSGSAWDAHANIEDNHTRMCRSSDQPVAALLSDLKARGLLDSTLVIWGGEFGRTPFNEKGDGRDHNPWGFSIWMAGGGIKPGTVVGSTDEIGLRAIDNPCHVNDIHATILHLMGLDHLKLTWFHNGRDERATVNGGRIIKELLA